MAKFTSMLLTVQSSSKKAAKKHPVSALAELCTKKRWEGPIYTLMDEGGVSHQKYFMLEFVSIKDYTDLKRVAAAKSRPKKWPP